MQINRGSGCSDLGAFPKQLWSQVLSLPKEFNNDFGKHPWSPRCVSQKQLVSQVLSYAGYTPQDNRADFGLIFPLPTILGNLTIISVDLKIISLDFPVCEVCVKSDWICSEEVGGAQISNVISERNPDVWGEPRGQTSI